MASFRFISALFLAIIASFAGGSYAWCEPDDEHFSIGMEGFYDRYREPSLDVVINSGYGSLTGNYNYDWGPAFLAVDGRVSLGADSYKSPSGSESGNPQWESELRLRGGTNITFMSGTLSPYIGGGMRYFIDEGKNTFTNLDYYAYDRRIFQTYIPIGMTYTYVTTDHWTLTPTIEYDRLIWGNVNSRLQEYTGGPNINNTQHDGYGLRAEFMVGQQESRSFSWQMGPFIRYWNIPDSDIAYFPGGYGYEPGNTRTQVGVALRAIW